MFGFTKKRTPETLAKQFLAILSNRDALQEFLSSFEAADQDLVKACVSRFCYLEWVAVYHAVQRRDERLSEEIIAAFLLLIDLAFTDRGKLFAVEEFFAATLESQLVLAKLCLEHADVPGSLPFEALTQMALKMRNESYTQMVKGQ